MSDRIAVVNAGSSSIKFGVFEMGLDEHLLFKGQVEQIGVAPRLSVRDSAGESLAEKEWDAKDLDHGSATRVILETIIGLERRQIRRGSRPQRRPWRHGFRGAGVRHGPCPGLAQRPLPARSVTPAAQPRRHRGYRRRRAAHAAGCVLRYGVSPRSAAARTEFRTSARTDGQRDQAVRFSRPFV